jgi:spore germination protein KB
MKLESERITTFQFTMSVACYIQASALLTSFIMPIAQQDSWMIVLFGIVAAMPLLFIYLALIRTFPGKNLIEMCECALGRVGGIIISLLFIWFFITLTSVNLSSFGVFIRQTMLIETPTIASTATCMLVCAYAVWHSLKAVTRYAAVFTFIAYMLNIVGIIFTLQIMDFNNFLPMFSQPAIEYVQSTHIMATIPYGELVAFLMITPYVAKGKKKMRTYLIGGFLLGCITGLSVVARDTAVLGNVGPLFAQPSFETLRLINIMASLNRVEILFAIVLIVLMFFKISFLYYVSVLATAQLFHLKSYNPLVLILGALIVAYSVFIYPSTTVRASLGREILPIFWMLFELALPLLLLIVGRARGLHKQANTASEVKAPAYSGQ